MNALLREYVKKSYEELLSLARSGLGEIMEYLSKDESTEFAETVCAILIRASIGVDGVLTEAEHRFYSDLLEEKIPFEKLERSVLEDNAEACTLANQIFDVSEEELKRPILTFCLCFLAVDRDAAREESDFIVRLLA